MERLFSGELSKLIIICGAISIGLSVLAGKLIAGIKGSFKPYKKQTLIYLFIAIILFAAGSLVSLPSISIRPMRMYIFLQCYFLLLGFLHVYFLPDYIKWSGAKNTWLPELMLALVIMLLGAALFALLFRLINRSGFQNTMATAVLAFVFPWLFLQLYQRAIAIPPKILRQWLYPLGLELEEPDESRFKNLLVISFEFQKKIGDARITNFRAKAPVDMEFGKLFYYFINDYNDRHPNDRIQVADSNGLPSGWIFYKKQKWYNLVTGYIDAERSIFNNAMRENDVIICERL